MFRRHHFQVQNDKNKTAYRMNYSVCESFLMVLLLSLLFFELENGVVRMSKGHSLLSLILLACTKPSLISKKHCF